MCVCVCHVIVCDMRHCAGPQDGFIYITGRAKGMSFLSACVPISSSSSSSELIITAGGENIGPVAIENTLKEELPIVSHVVLIGDQRKFLSCLLTLKVIHRQTDRQKKEG